MDTKNKIVIITRARRICDLMDELHELHEQANMAYEQCIKDFTRFPRNERSDEEIATFFIEIQANYSCMIPLSLWALDNYDMVKLRDNNHLKLLEYVYTSGLKAPPLPDWLINLLRHTQQKDSHGL